ncbi:cupin-like domain-containing protein [Sarocladium implicatum]|nr:cupin-like domain-containing protein [Sarocladium implicatum]
MRQFPRWSVSFARRFHTSPKGLKPLIAPVDFAHAAAVDIDTFRQQAFAPEKPLLISKGTEGHPEKLQISKKWFEHGEDGRARLSSHVTSHEDCPFPYEVVIHPGISLQAMEAFRDWLMKSGDFKDQILAGTVQSVISEAGDQKTFHQLYAPLRLLTQAVEFNHERQKTPSGMVQIYIAQSSLADLPQSLQADLPPPEMVLKAGKGDIYASSIWLGTEPTFTPLHRDPNPNLFCQLQGTKAVRLLPPQIGEMLYFEVQARIRQQGSSKIRTAEGMMQGLERRVLEDAVWGDDVDLKEMREAKVDAGDSLFIPKGWWHSIRSWGSAGALNGSVNWWFR